MRIRALLRQRSGAREFRIKSRIDLRKRMDNRLAPILSDNFDSGYVAGRIAINESLRRLLETFGVEERVAQSERPCTINGQHEKASHGEVQSQGICQSASRN